MKNICSSNHSNTFIDFNGVNAQFGMEMVTVTDMVMAE
jgi:hypothetical protein